MRLAVHRDIWCPPAEGRQGLKAHVVCWEAGGFGTRLETNARRVRSVLVVDLLGVIHTAVCVATLNSPVGSSVERSCPDK